MGYGASGAIIRYIPFLFTQSLDSGEGVVALVSQNSCAMVESPQKFGLNQPVRTVSQPSQPADGRVSHGLEADGVFGSRMYAEAGKPVSHRYIDGLGVNHLSPKCSVKTALSWSLKTIELQSFETPNP